MIKEFQSRCDIKPTSDLDVYCRLEDVSPLLIYRTAVKEKVHSKSRYAGKRLYSLFAKWMERVKSLRLASPDSTPLSKLTKRMTNADCTMARSSESHVK